MTSKSIQSQKTEPPKKVRIIGGIWRSRLLTVLDLPGLRPTTDRIRETLFNWLGQDLRDLDCLDLFSGTGALGFEASSRGASRVVLLEKDKKYTKKGRDGPFIKNCSAKSLFSIFAENCSGRVLDHDRDQPRNPSERNLPCHY